MLDPSESIATTSATVSVRPDACCWRGTARVVDHQELRFVYALLTAAWSYPMIALLVAGTARHRRRLRSTGHDLDWSIQGDRVV